MTFSLVARSDDGLSWGVAVASRFLAVGSAVPAAVACVGAIATQADANVAWKGEALALLDEGATAEVALARLLEEDDGREDRQVGLVDLDGSAAAFTGDRCFDWAGHRTGPGFAAQGNILAGPEVLDAMVDAWTSTAGLPLARRLLVALASGDAAGGDRRGRQSAALFVVREGAGYGGRDDVAVDLRVDDHPHPVTELARLLDLNDFYLTASTDEEKVTVTPELADELRRRTTALGHEHVAEWVGSQNYEMRVDTALTPRWIDRRVLEILRSSSDDLRDDEREDA
ncbi:DUF1028 domain-containing protein [Nocardioides solisilvae]|uniref:DUF1028 domain-containing protein n=1 Tax=Nocardioides solisilvae TaxID=1542435 RepID=UPI000D74A97D|nr:DUF1028 domain-containing protein [Nocardioides solisilvae]